MKWARWCEANGHEYQYVTGIVEPSLEPDVILTSCIFTYFSKRYEETINHYLGMFPNAKMIAGGVFPTLNPQWFEKWDRVETHRGLHPDIENLIPYRTFEQTRHTYASLLLAEGGKIGYISKQMGHKNIYITLTRYAKYLPDENDVKILSKVTEMLQRLGDFEKSENRNNLET